MELQYQITRKEFIDFHLKYYKMTIVFISGILGRYIIAFCAFMGSIVYAGIISSPSYNTSYTFISSVFLILLLIYIVKHRISEYAKKICTIYKSDIYDNYFLSTKLTVSKEGIQVITDICNTFFKWYSLRKVYIVDNFLMMLTYTDDFVFIPIYTLETDDKNLLLNTIQQNSNITIIKEYPKEFRYI